MAVKTMTEVLKRYILLKIWGQEWKPGHKVNSLQELSIMFNVSFNVVRRTLLSFCKSNILVAVPKKGFYVNKDLYKLVPLSLREKYPLKLTETTWTSKKKIVLKKCYETKNKMKIWVESTFEHEVYFDKDILKEKSFMYLLAYNGIVISKIESKKTIKTIDGTSYVVENRKLYTLEDKLIVKEIIYIPTAIWQDEIMFSI